MQLFQRPTLDFPVTRTKSAKAIAPGPQSTIGGRRFGPSRTVPPPPPETEQFSKTIKLAPRILTAAADFLTALGPGGPKATLQQQQLRQSSIENAIDRSQQQGEFQAKLAQQGFQNLLAQRRLGLEAQGLEETKKRTLIAEKAEARRAAEAEFQQEIAGKNIVIDTKAGIATVVDKARFTELQKAGQDPSGAVTVIPLQGLNADNAAAISGLFLQAMGKENDPDKRMLLAGAALQAREKGSIEPFVDMLKTLFQEDEKLRRSQLLASFKAGLAEPDNEDIDDLAESLALGELELRDIPAKFKVDVVRKAKSKGNVIVSQKQREVINTFDSLDRFVDSLEEAVKGIEKGENVVLNLDRLSRRKAALGAAARAISTETGRLTNEDLERVETVFPTTLITLSSQLPGFPNLARDRLAQIRGILKEAREREVGKVQRSFKRRTLKADPEIDETGFDPRKLD